MTTVEDLISAIETLESKDLAKFLYKTSKEDYINYAVIYSSLPIEMKEKVLLKLKEYTRRNRDLGDQIFSPEVMEA